MASLDEVLDFLNNPGVDKDVASDIIRLRPELSIDDAYRLQLASKRRRAQQGDAIAGYQASLTSAAAQKAVPGVQAPMVGSLLRSLVREDGATVPLDADLTFIETEIAVLLDSDLSGPSVDAAQALAAIRGFYAAIEVAPVREGVLEGKWSNQHLIAVQKAPGGFVVLGKKLLERQQIADIRLEGAVITIDGQVRASAAGVEAMGSPLNVVAAVANRLALYGERLRAGMIVMTGSLPAPQRISREARTATVEFTRLGSVTVNFAH